MIGKTLAHHEIVARIGTGGMGEVYRTRDTNLDRNVAIKILPGPVAENRKQLVRLEREAKAIASIAHPNIVAVYDFGTDDGTGYIVTELLEGDTLRERLARGALPPRKVTASGPQKARVRVWIDAPIPTASVPQEDLGEPARNHA